MPCFLIVAFERCTSPTLNSDINHLLQSYKPKYDIFYTRLSFLNGALLADGRDHGRPDATAKTLDMVLRNCGGGSAGEAASPQTLSSTTLIFVFAVPQQVNIGLMSFLWVKLRPAQGDRYAHVKPHHALRPV